MEAPLPLVPAPPISAGVPAPAASVDSSPRSRHNDSLDDPPMPPPPLAPKLRLMCSYGGHVVPRPHDKTLCYVGGDTRIIVIDRHTSLADLHHRLSTSLLQNEPFSLKYQLPSEDLDSLISVTTDEDFENMVEEYERISNAGGSAKPGRLRLFLFPKSFSGIEQLLLETASIKSEDWFFNTLNGKSSVSAAASDREFSETSSINCLLGLDDDSLAKTTVAEKDVKAQVDASNVGSNNGTQNLNLNSVANHDVHSVPDSPMLDTTSSFGSASSSPSLPNLPPIRVHVDESPKVGVLGIEEQFQQLSVGVAGNVNMPVPQKQGDTGGFLTAGVAPGAVVAGFPVVAGSEYGNRVVSDVKISDHGGDLKVHQIQPPVQDQVQPQHIPQYHKKQTSVYDFPSPDSVSSEGSATNPLSRQRQVVYQEPFIQIHSGNTRISSNQVDLQMGDQMNHKVPMHLQAQDPGYMFSGQYDQIRSQLQQPQQFVHASNQYIPAGTVPIASYYPVYPSHQQHHPHQPMLDQQYSIYFTSARQNQPYNLSMQQPSYNELAPAAPSSHPQMPPASMAPQSAHSQVRSIPSSKPELAGGAYRTSATTAPQLVPAPSSHHGTHYAAFAQAPSQTMTPASNSNYMYEFTDSANAQIYYTPLPPQLAAQFQTLTPAPQMVIPDASTQLPAESK